MLIFPDPNVETEYTDPNGSVWAFNGTGWVRQPDCPDGGDGGDGGGGGFDNDSLWPLPPKPSVDLLGFPGTASQPSGVKETYFFKIEDDGSLSTYDRIEGPLGSYSMAFANKRPLVAVFISSNTLSVYDYSTSPMTLIKSINVGMTLDNYAFSANDTFLFVNSRKNYAVYKESALGANDWAKYGSTARFFEEEAEAYADAMGLTGDERLGAWNGKANTLVAFPSATEEEEALFIVTMDVTAAAVDSTILIEATPTAPAIVHSCGVRSYNTAVSAYASRIITSCTAHPYAPYAAYSLSAVTNGDYDPNWNAGVLSVTQRNKKVSDHSKMSFRTSRDQKCFAPIFSPSGNYLIVKEDSSQIWINRFCKDGGSEVIATLPHNNQENAFQWSHDEKYLYTWGRQEADPDTGYTGVIRAYEFTESGATLIGPVGYVPGNPSSATVTSMHRSKF